MDERPWGGFSTSNAPTSSCSSGSSLVYNVTTCCPFTEKAVTALHGRYYYVLVSWLSIRGCRPCSNDNEVISKRRGKIVWE